MFHTAKRVDTSVWYVYRYLNHQKGIIGYIKVRLVAARDLGKTSVTSHKPQAQLQQQVSARVKGLGHGW